MLPSACEDLMEIHLCWSRSCRCSFRLSSPVLMMHLPTLWCRLLSSSHFFVARSGLCGVVRKRSTLRLQQPSECACALVPILIALQPGQCMNMLLCCSFSLYTGYSERYPAEPPKHSDDAVDCLFVPSVLSLQSSNLSSYEYPICCPNAALCTVVPHSEPNDMLVSRIHPVQRFGGWRSCPYFPELFNRLLHDLCDNLRECCHRATATTVTLRAMARLRQ